MNDQPLDYANVNAAAEPVSVRKPMRVWPAIAICVLAVLVLVGFWVWPDVLRQNRILLSQLACIIVAALLIVWLLFVSRLPGRTRLMAFGGLIVIAAAVGGSIRRIEYSGDMWLVPVWRWSPEADLAGAITSAESAAKTADDGVDFTRITDDDYPRFLGPRGDGIIPGVSLAPDFSAHPPELLWRQPIGRGWSSFAVANGFAVTQEQRDDKELVVCYEVATGRVRWVHTDDASFDKPPSGAGPRATPTLADSRVYTFGVTGILNCLEDATGEPVWSVNVVEDGGKMSAWGKSSSPLLVDNLVVVSAGGTDGNSLVAYDRYTGERVWRGGDRRSGYASALVATLAGVRQIVILNANGVTGHDPTDGHVLWDHPWGQSINVSQPVPIGDDQLFVSTGYGEGCALLRLATDDDGKFTVTETWRNRNIKAKFTNVVRRGDDLYGLDDGILVCLDVGTGKRKWKRGRYGHGQALLFDNVLLIQAESGDVVLVDATPEGHHELSRFPALDAKTWNHPAYWQGHLLVRNDQEAACYRLPINTAE
jgi:outer membrane protein assembly factor BamB